MFGLLFAQGKIISFEQLKDNFDLEAVRLYYLGGSLISWLEMCGKSEIAEMVRNIAPDKDIDAQLAEIFEQPVPVKVDIENERKFADAEKSVSSYILRDNPLEYAVSANSRFFVHHFVQTALLSETETGSYSLPNSSFYAFISSFEYKTGSFEYGIGSFRYESEYESEYETGSFGYKTASFAFEQGSFSAAASSYLFSNTSFNYYATSFSSSSFTSCCDDILSCYSSNNSEEISKTPEEKIYENLSYCPLNRFGYGIHLI